jgi:hypothetical protein
MELSTLSLWTSPTPLVSFERSGIRSNFFILRSGQWRHLRDLVSGWRHDFRTVPMHSTASVHCNVEQNCLSRRGVDQLCAILFDKATEYSNTIVRGPAIFHRLLIPSVSMTRQRANHISDSREMPSSTISLNALDSNVPSSYDPPLDIDDLVNSLPVARSVCAGAYSEWCVYLLTT